MNSVPTRTYPYFAIADLRAAKSKGVPYTFGFGTDDPKELGLLQKQVDGSRHPLESYRQHRFNVDSSDHRSPLYAASTEIDYLYLQLEPGLGYITGTWSGDAVSEETPKGAE
jgi:hypothetical protein